jgi:hypothetical protein
MAPFNLAQFRPENQLYGFAVWQLLHPYLETGMVMNQCGTPAYNEDLTQSVLISFDYDAQHLPPHYHQYELGCRIDPTSDFEDQLCNFEVTEAFPTSATTVYVCTTTYRISLKQAIHILPHLRIHAHLLLPLLDVFDTDEGEVELDQPQEAQ